MRWEPTRDVLVKVKFAIEQAVKAQRGGRDIALLHFLSSALGGGVKYRRLGGPQGWSGQMWKISPSPGFYSWAIQHVVSHYTDSAIPALGGYWVWNFAFAFIFKKLYFTRSFCGFEILLVCRNIFISYN
jgi:hypothetical protein